jgi:hypothetical protein
MDGTEGQEAEVLDAPQFEDDSTAEDIAEAKTLGWKDPADWKGAPPKNGFVKASEYVKRGETVIPIIKSQLSKSEKENQRLAQEFAAYKTEQAEKLARMEKMNGAALKRQREQLEDEYSARIDKATEVGDTAKVRELRAKERDALKEFDAEAAETKKEEKKEAKNGLPSDVQDTITAWIKENDWYDSDEDMQAVAIRHHGKLLRDHPSWTMEKNLEETRKYVVKRFPAEFEDKSKTDDEDDKPRRKGSPVEGGGSRGGDSGGRSAWSKIPADAQKQADKFIKDDGLFLSKGETAEKDLQKARERYAVEYLGEDK